MSHATETATLSLLDLTPEHLTSLNIRVQLVRHCKKKFNLISIKCQILEIFSKLMAFSVAKNSVTNTSGTENNLQVKYFTINQTMTFLHVTSFCILLIFRAPYLKSKNRIFIRSLLCLCVTAILLTNY